MKILFYYDPISHRQDAIWRDVHVKADRPLVQSLLSTPSRPVSCRLLANSSALRLATEELPKSDLIPIEENDILALFRDKHGDLNRIWHENRYTQEQLLSASKVVSDRMGNFQPDVIISWTPVPFLRKLWPNALVLHKEGGFFQRAPYPGTFFLDPLGYYDQSLLHRIVPSLERKELPTRETKALSQLRRFFFDLTLSKTPLHKECSTLRKRFRKILLLPLQYNDYFTFDSLCDFRTQYAYAKSVLECIAPDISVILTIHPYSSISRPEIDDLKGRFDNLIYLDQVEALQNPSDMLLPFVDGVITVSSSLGLKAIFWKKKLITLGRSYLDWVDDAQDLDQVEHALSLPYQESKDGFLCWYLFHYTIPYCYCERQGWLHDYLAILIGKQRSRQLDKSFDAPVENPSTLAADFIRHADTRIPAFKAKPRPEQPVWDASSTVTGLRILFLYAAGRYNASGFYLQDLAAQLVRQGHQCLIIAGGRLPPGGQENGVIWINFAFEGYLLRQDVKRILLGFSPDILYLINIRAKPMQATLEMHISTGAPISVQSEDDDTTYFLNRYPNPQRALLEILDCPKPTGSEIHRFLTLLDWDQTLSILTGQQEFYDVEPLLRALCYHLSELNTAIWYPLSKKLSQSFRAPSIVVPPIINLSEYDPRPLDLKERHSILKQYGISENTLVVFVGGTVYGFSKEFDTLLESLCYVSATYPTSLVISGRSQLNLEGAFLKYRTDRLRFYSMDIPNDREYIQMMRASDVIASPGFPDTFNRYRLPSRLVKAMALAKPIFTCRTGFGESLSHGDNAILTETTDPTEWANKLQQLSNVTLRKKIGDNARQFAGHHFHVGPVAKSLAQEFHKIKRSQQGTILAANNQGVLPQMACAITALRQLVPGLKKKGRQIVKRCLFSD